ncbi:hypothetical protein [Kribbella sp. NPDC003557]|uniref:hypothetical protein n=1 Tax=Kribbella sp. NPDC003557 TaxID=3154449 RepID=UPI0033B675C3
MTDRIQVDLNGVDSAAEACRQAGGDARAKLTGLMLGLTREAIESAAGHDDYGKQITDGWVNSGAAQFPEGAKSIEAELLGRGYQMSGCADRTEATDADASQQVRATDLGLARVADHWEPAPQGQD